MLQIKSLTKHIKSFALIGGSMVMVTALSACQSTASKTAASSPENHHPHAMQKYANMSDEQKQQLQAKRQQMAEQRIAVCAGKSVGDSVQIQHANQVKTGQCQVMFQLDDNSKSALRSTFQAAHQLAYQDANTLTAEQRELIKQNRQAIRTERQAMYQQLQTACQGQSLGKTINIQLAQQNLSGQCVLQYQPTPSQTTRQS